MFTIRRVIKILIVYLMVSTVTCSISGLNYMDPINNRRLDAKYPRGEDPCNPLYWYPRNIPEYCQYRNIPIPSNPGKPINPPLPMPLPVPVQPPAFMPMPPSPPLPVPLQPPTFMPMLPPPPVPVLSPLPYGMPILPTNPMLPVVRPPYVYPDPSYPYASYPYSFHAPSSNLQQIGMVPGLPGLVTSDNGINILPFSDAYTNLLENHKNMMIRKRLRKLIREYEDFPNNQR